MSQLTSILLLLLLSANSLSQAQDRHIHLNGNHLEPDQIQAMDQVFLTTVPDGYYWLDDNTGQWGYENNPQPQGLVPAAQQQLKQAEQTSSATSTEINSSQNGSVVTGNLDGKRCTFASAGGMTIKSCD